MYVYLMQRQQRHFTRYTLYNISCDCVQGYVPWESRHRFIFNIIITILNIPHGDPYLSLYCAVYCCCCRIIEYNEFTYIAHTHTPMSSCARSKRSCSGRPLPRLGRHETKKKKRSWLACVPPKGLYPDTLVAFFAMYLSFVLLYFTIM